MKYKQLRSKKNQFRKPCCRNRGTGLVELALIAPFLLAMVLGVIEFGYLERGTLVVANGAREGARAAALGQSTSKIYTRIVNATTPVLQTDAAGNITNGAILMEQASPAATPVYTSWPADSGTGTYQRNGVPPGNYVRISVSYNHRSITGLLNRTVTVPVVMRCEG